MSVLPETVETITHSLKSTLLDICDKVTTIKEQFPNKKPNHSSCESFTKERIPL